MATLKNKLIQLVDATADKLNTLYEDKEEISNKKQDLTSTNTEHYPSVPAVKLAVDTAESNANNYTDTAISNLPDYILASTKGAAGGVAELDSNGLVPSSQLPSYVDDVVDLQDFVTINPAAGMEAGQKWYNETTKKIFTATSPTVGEISDPEDGKIYVHVGDNTIWRWSGTVMVQVVGGLALGETPSTAYRGDRGKEAYDHSQLTSGNPHNVTKSDVGLGNVDNTSDLNKPVSTAQGLAIAVVQDDLNGYRTDIIGEDPFPDYAAQLIAGVNF